LAVGIHLVGTPRIEIDGRPVAGPRGSKAWALLAYLVLGRAPAPRERLAGLLFADADDPLGALRWNLAELRRAIGPRVSLAGDPVVLELPPDAFVDVLALGSATWLEAVMVPGLGRELLEGIFVQAGAAFDAWLLAERRHVARLSAAVLREAATARLAMGSGEQAVELATKLVALDEFDEEANTLLVHAYLAVGAGDGRSSTSTGSWRGSGGSSGPSRRRACSERSTPGHRRRRRRAPRAPGCRARRRPSR
jgi:DNA-binding SARP family transcriptional activator